MGYAIIVFSSSTAASRLKRLASKAGINSAGVVQTPKSVSKNGCSYALKCPTSVLSVLKSLADEYGLNYTNIYRELISPDGTKSYELY
ncbi:MAG: DUF3343 domain-containing protein [Clostridia bacterium]|nr:DUF3343 domain-containing protein [Clostridia bacterium]